MPQTPPTLLFVDDDTFHADYWIEELVDTGFDVTAAASTDQALATINVRTFDIVVLDIMMDPGGLKNFQTGGGVRTGKFLAREIRRMLPGCRIVALTHSNDPDIRSWFTRDASVAFFHKDDISYADFALALRRMLGLEERKNRVFIVHGRDSAALEELKVFVSQRLRLGDPIVLAEQPSRGMTLIEKLEFYAKMTDLVFVLFTPDDVGALAQVNPSLRSRPRMNVVFEYGYFIGALRRRRGRVFLLTKGSIEMPSDLAGIVHISICDGLESAMPTFEIELQDWLKATER